MTVENNQKVYLGRALALAGTAWGRTTPNPMVGAVIVGPDGRIVGEGCHRLCGQGHAEVNALAQVSKVDAKLLPQSTMYVTLEPCSHHGRTGPCAQLLIDRGVGHVVVGTKDPFFEVAGRGINMLREAGIKVTMASEDLAADCRALNAQFITAHTQKRPFVTLKWAQSADRCIDARRHHGDTAARFSNALTMADTHRVRRGHDAVLIGTGTALADSPRLDVRRWPHCAGRQPQPVVVGMRRAVTSAMPVEPILYQTHDLLAVLSDLYGRGVTSVLVEGGAEMLQSFIDAGLWDAARVETAVDLHLADQANEICVLAPKFNVNPLIIKNLGRNTLAYYSNNPLFTASHPMVAF